MEMRIALLSDGIPPFVIGGIQSHSRNLAVSLARLGVQVDLYFSNRGNPQISDPSPEFEGASEENIHPIFIPWPKGDRLPGHYLRESKSYSKAVYQALRKRPPVSHIYAQGYTALFLNSLPAAERLSLPPISVNGHGYNMYQPSADRKSALQMKMLKPAMARQLKAADYTISLGGKLSEILTQKVGVDPRQVVTLPNGISEDWLDSTALTPLSGPRSFLFIGRYERLKGIEEYQQVIARNPQWQDQARFTFVGPIPEQVRLRLPHISYTGLVKDKEQLKAIYREHHMTVVPSVSEGMPTVILEGMALGLSSIATNVGAVEELVAPNETGILIPPGDSNALQGAIQQAIDMSDEHLDGLRSRAQQLIQSEFSWADIARKTLTHFSQSQTSRMHQA